MAGRAPFRRQVSRADGKVLLGLASLAVHALCDACVVAAIREHKFEMMSQFKQLKEEIASGSDRAAVHRPSGKGDSCRAQADISHRLPARGW